MSKKKKVGPGDSVWLAKCRLATEDGFDEVDNVFVSAKDALKFIEDLEYAEVSWRRSDLHGHTYAYWGMCADETFDSWMIQRRILQ